MSETELEPAPDATEEPGERRSRRRASKRRNTIEWILVVVGAFVFAIIIKTFLFQAFYIPSGSMEPTLDVGDRVLVNRLSYKFHDVNRGDIVVFRRPTEHADSVTVEDCSGSPVTINRAGFANEQIDDLIKRVVALPGETVEQRDGRIYIDGKELSESYLPDGRSTPAFQFPAQCIRVPKDEVFVLGDNRQNSQASNLFGPIPEDLIIGRAFIRVWPIGSIGTL